MRKTWWSLDSNRARRSWRATPLPQSTRWTRPPTTTAWAIPDRLGDGSGPPAVPSSTRRVSLVPATAQI